METKQFLDLDKLGTIWKNIDKYFLRKNVVVMNDDTINSICDDVLTMDKQKNN